MFLFVVSMLCSVLLKLQNLPFLEVKGYCVDFGDIILMKIFICYKKKKHLNFIGEKYPRHSQDALAINYAAIICSIPISI